MCHPYRLMTEINTIMGLNKKIIIPNYEILKNITNKNKKLINYNYLYKKNHSINKSFCGFNKNLVLVYALSFCLKEKIKKIRIYGLTTNDENMNIIKIFQSYIKKNKINSSIFIL